jgi:hypothetical protein
MRTVFRAVLLTSLIASGAWRLCASTIDVVFWDNRFGTINDATGAYTQISTLPINEAGGIASLNDLTYLEDLNNDLLTVNPLNGVSHLVGNAGLQLTVGAFAGGPGGLFEVDYASNLYSINPSTGVATLVGATRLAPNNGGFDTSLSSDGTSLLYTAGRAGQSDELYSINVKTGVATDLGSTGVTGIAGSAFINGNLELYQYGQATNYIYTAPDGSANFTRGTPLGAQIIDGGVEFDQSAQVSSLAAKVVSPEPQPVILMTFGLIIFWLVRRRSKLRMQ